MTEQRIDSAAFQKAQLQSERHRIFGVVAFVTLFTAIVGLRIVVYGSQMCPWGIVALVVLVAYEFVALRFVDRCLHAEKELPRGLWFLTVLLESSFPAVGIAFLSSPRLEARCRPLATPWVLAFFPFLILSVLRLSPRACRVAGTIAALSYLGAAFHLGWRPR